MGHTRRTHIFELVPADCEQDLSSVYAQPSYGRLSFILDRLQRAAQCSEIHILFQLY